MVRGSMVVLRIVGITMAIMGRNLGVLGNSLVRNSSLSMAWQAVTNNGRKNKREN